jgi:ubiquinone biosynthesis protein UbiJ
VAEEVEKISPDLVVRDSKGQAYTVRYSAVNAMLLNEIRKQHEVVADQGKTIAELRSQVAAMSAAQREIAEQHAEIEALKARLDKVDALTARLNTLEKVAANN